MLIIDRYILRAVLLGSLLAMAALLPLVAFLVLADELRDVGSVNYTLADAFAYMALSLPRYAYLLFPMVALIGSLLGLGSLAAHSELVAMRAAGISLERILGSVLRAGLVLALLAWFMGELVAPASEEQARQLRAEALSAQIALKTRYGFWVRDGDAFINIRQILPGGQLRDLYIYEFDPDKRLQLSTHAQEAVYAEGVWQLRNIRQTELREEGLQTRTLDTAAWKSLLDPAMLSLLLVDPNILPVWSLYRYIHFMEDNGLNALTYEVAFWGKVAMPLVILAMLFLSVPLLFNAQRRLGLGQRIFTGVLIGIAFYVLNRALAQLPLVYAFNPLLAAFLPGLLCVGAGLLILRRVR